MRTTQQMSITLPLEMAELVRAKVQSGEYASESEVIRDGLRSLSARDRALESWLKREVVSAYDALEKEPNATRDASQVRARLRAERQKLA